MAKHACRRLLLLLLPLAPLLARLPHPRALAAARLFAALHQRAEVSTWSSVG